MQCPATRGGHGNAGYVLGAIVGLVGVVLLVGGTLRRAWDAIPVDDKRTNSPEKGNPD